MSKFENINIDEPRWDQNTYLGRAKHFFNTTNPLNLFNSAATLNSSKEIVEKHRAGHKLENQITLDELYKAKTIYDSAFHPQTGEKLFIIGRMSAQVPMNMLITGCMMSFYKSTPAVVFWQWVNQSFNAIVNYCNRSGSSMGLEQMGKSYALATSGAVSTALLLNKMVTRAPPLVGRFVPFAAVAAANCINIPAMRSKELTEGISVFDENNEELGLSRRAAMQGTMAVIVSRIIMASPSMGLTPVLINYLEKKRAFVGRKWLEPTVQVLFCGLVLTFATPMACALFIQKVPIKVEELESELQDVANKMQSQPKIVYYNKGL